MKWVETWEGSRRTFLSQLWVGGGILTECLTNKTRHRLFQYSRQKTPLAHHRGMRGERDSGRKKRQLMREPAGCMVRWRQAWNHSSPVVNLSLPLPPPVSSKMEGRIWQRRFSSRPRRCTHSCCTDRWCGCLINTGFDGGRQQMRGESKAIADCKQQSWAAIIWLLLFRESRTWTLAHNSLLMTHPFKPKRCRLSKHHCSCGMTHFR